MGSTTFRDEGKGKTAADAFLVAKADAQWEYGHGGYTGTIAEKPGCIEFPVPAGCTAHEVADVLGRAFRGDGDWMMYGPYDHETGTTPVVPLPDWFAALPYYKSMCAVYDQKWEDCVALKIEEGRYLFCGWASC